MNIETIAAGLERVRWSGRHSFTACCPAHHDRSPSLSVTEDGQMVLVHCHAGCDHKSVLDALGFREKRNPLSNPRPRPEPKPPATYDYAVKAWRASDDSAESHPYAIRKRITHAFGARRGVLSGKLIGRETDCLLIPNRDWEGRLIGVEAINPEGVKQTFGTKGLLVLGYPEDSLMIHVCEGWATAWALSQLFPERFGGVVAFGKSRLEQYAADAQTRFQVNIAVHQEANNRDVWDLWIAGEGKYYAHRTRMAAGV